LPWQFVLGLCLAALGGCLVTLYKPAPAATPEAAVTKQASSFTSNPASRPFGPTLAEND